MPSNLTESNIQPFAGRPLEVYSLGCASFDSVLALKQRLIYEVSDAPQTRSALILCEHPTMITIGRSGSQQQILAEQLCVDNEPIEVRYINRGGATWLHGPGQLMVYPIFPIEPCGIALNVFRNKLYETIAGVLAEHQLSPTNDRRSYQVCCQDKAIAAIGLALKSATSYHGFWLNVDIPGSRLKWINQSQQEVRFATSIAREKRAPVRMATVRQQVLEHLRQQFGFSDFVFCTPPPVKVAPDQLESLPIHPFLA